MHCIRVIHHTLHKCPSPMTLVYSSVTFARCPWVTEEERVAEGFPDGLPRPAAPPLFFQLCRVKLIPEFSRFLPQGIFAATCSLCSINHSILCDFFFKFGDDYYVPVRMNSPNHMPLRGCAQSHVLCGLARTLTMKACPNPCISNHVAPAAGIS